MLPATPHLTADSRLVAPVPMIDAVMVCVVETVTERHRCRRERLSGAEAAVHASRAPPPEQPKDREHHEVGGDEPDDGRDHHRDDDLVAYTRPQHRGPGGERRSDEAADER